MLLQQLGLPFLQDVTLTKEQLAVIWYIRLPRMLVGMLVGGALGCESVQSAKAHAYARRYGPAAKDSIGRQEIIRDGGAGINYERVADSKLRNNARYACHTVSPQSVRRGVINGERHR